MTAVPDWELVGPNDTDADWVRASLAGDRTAFGQMYDRYANRLHDFCIGMLHDRDGAADCVQDCFCVAATRLPQLRDPEKLRPWLYSIARNEALRRLRERRREAPSEELPDEMSYDPGPDTLAARTELADLIAEAAGGLSDRDQAVLELAYRHGLDPPELAEALGVSQTSANTMVRRLRQTIERSLGALLVSRRARNNPDGCPDLIAILDGWDGKFTILMRKRIARHIESCPTCDEERKRMVSPAALLGAAPAFIPAPGWLRERTLTEVELTCFGTAIDGEPDNAAAPTRASPTKPAPLTPTRPANADVAAGWCSGRCY
jgi:RNA polymerase sigma factor (sigma-70 family)